MPLMLTVLQPCLEYTRSPESQGGREPLGHVSSAAVSTLGARHFLVETGLHEYPRVGVGCVQETATRFPVLSRVYWPGAKQAAVKTGPSTQARSPEGMEHFPQTPMPQLVIRSTRW